MCLEMGEERVPGQRGNVRHGRNMINIRLIHHRRHRALNIALRKLKLTVLVPNILELKIRALEQRFQKF